MGDVTSYVQSRGPAVREAFEKITSIVKHIIPEAKETTMYGVPAYSYKGKYCIAVYEYKKHLSLFPSSAPIEVLKDQLAEFTLSKGTIQFTVEKQLPQKLIETIVQMRKDAIEQL
jgi:uncharacterized protein YdhG (YjbR/CyaY superfamily)